MKSISTVAFVVFAAIAAGCSDGNVFSLETGSCFNDDSEGAAEVTNVPVVDCSEAHDNEVYFTYDLPDGDYPGETAITESATERCVAEFAGYVGSDFQTSSLDVSWLSPTTESWDRDDREVTCILFDGQLQKLTGSADNSGL